MCIMSKFNNYFNCEICEIPVGMCRCYGYRVWLQVHLIVYVYYAYNVHNVGIMGGYKYKRLGNGMGKG